MEKSDSPTVVQRYGLDSAGAVGQAQSDQAVSQNVLWLCKNERTRRRSALGFLERTSARFPLAKRLSEVISSPRQSLRNAAESSMKKVLPGVVVTSSRTSRRRISSVAATHAFAAATAGESPKFSRNERLASTTGRASMPSVDTCARSMIDKSRWQCDNGTSSNDQRQWQSFELTRTETKRIYHCEYRDHHASSQHHQTLADEASTRTRILTCSTWLD